MTTTTTTTTTGVGLTSEAVAIRADSIATGTAATGTAATDPAGQTNGVIGAGRTATRVIDERTRNGTGQSRTANSGIVRSSPGTATATAVVGRRRPQGSAR